MSETSSGDTEHDEIPGDYDTVGGIRRRASALGNPIIPMFVDRAEERVFADGDGYRIEAPETDGPNDAEMLFHFGILLGAALEREYPAPNRSPGADTEHGCDE